MKVCCITNDVEATTITGESYNESIAGRVEKEALPVVLALYEKYGVKATFFCQGLLAQQHPEIVRVIDSGGHEIGSHGWIHDCDKSFDLLSFEEQMDFLTKTRNVIEDLSGKRVVSFRAPALRVNENTVKALVATGHKFDSSVAPQRLDSFMSLGAKRKLKWILAPRSIYQTSTVDLSRSGKSDIKEIPVSAVGLPYISTLMRISPILTKLTRWLLFLETRKDNSKVVTFLFHPGEVLDIEGMDTSVVRRSNNLVVYFFSDFLRSKLKRRNLGLRCLELLEDELRFWKRHGYEFKTIGEL